MTRTLALATDVNVEKLHILVLGAGGFIGRHIVGELVRQGHIVRAVLRRADGLARALPDCEIVAMDLAKACASDDWRAALAGIHVVVNAAGLLRGGAMSAVHVDMPRALHVACAAAGVRRVVLISAISARADVATDYARTKLAGEDELRGAGIGWTILRPSLVYGDGSYGGTSLMRGLAGLPIAIPVPGDGHFAFTPIHARDLARAVRLACEKAEFDRQTLEPVGPETFTLRELLGRYRTWLGFGPARVVAVPMPLMALLGRIGDLMSEGPVATNSLRQMVAGNAGDSAAFEQAIGFRPASLAEEQALHPAQVQDRWHARLFFLAPALTVGLAAMWIASALLGWLFGQAQTVALVDALGLPAASATPLRVLGTVIDVVVAGVLLADRRAYWSTWLQLIVVTGYTVVIGVALPQLWLDPLGPLLKNLPILLAILVRGAIGDNR